MDSPSRTTPYPMALAAEKYSRTQVRPFIRHLLRLFTQKPDETLLSFDQVHQLVRDRSQIDRGTQYIPLSRIIGSVGRYRDFDRAFLPLRGADAERWMKLDIALNELQDVPPIDVYQIGDVYFVRDGNHRVSVAKANGLDVIEARVTEVPIMVPLTPETDVDDLIIKTEYAQFLRQTQLDETRPEQKIELTEPGRYQILLEHINVHRYYLGLQWGREPTLAEAAASWYDHVYMPVIQAIEESSILKEFPERTEADLYLWVAYHRERLRKRYGEMPPDREVAATLADRFGGRRFGRFAKMIARAVNAALRAAAETPEPPLAVPSTLDESSEGQP